MKNRFVFLLSLLLLLFAENTTYAQKLKRNKLEAKRKALKTEIKKIKTYLEKTKKKEKNLSNQVQDLSHKIATRQDLIHTISDEIISLSDEIVHNAAKIDSLEQDLRRLQTDYAKLIYKSYKNKSESSRLLFILSSKNFLQGFQRFQYMKQYTKYRKSQGDSILVKARRLQAMNDSLTVLKITKSNLIDEKKHEQNIILTEKQKQEKLVAKYHRQKRKYINQLRKKQREERKLTQQIENLIRGAIKKSGTKTKGFALTPAAKRLAGKFTANKGKLPWPVKKGLVTVRFGKQPDPMHSGVKIESSGVRIATQEGAFARAVFDGKVMAIQKNPQSGILSVLVQHGNYISVYANLESVRVSKGDPVKTKENLGIIHTDVISGKTILKFQIWKELTKQDPSKWVYKM